MTLPAAYFDDMYANDADPWGFRSRWYERRKYALTTAALTRPRYRNGYEPGCSIGVLTSLLAERCDALLAMDSATAAVRRAAEGVREHPHVRVEQGVVPDDWPTETFDLVVLSELGYYLDHGDLEATLDLVAATLERSGDLIAVHWRPAVADYPLCGDEVHRRIAQRREFTRLVRHEEADFLLEVYRRGAATSVAAEEGLW